MAKQKRTVLDGLATRARELLEDLERLLNPQPPKPARVPVPIPVQRPKRNPYR